MQAEIQSRIEEIAKQAKAAARQMAQMSSAVKNMALYRMADEIEHRQAMILAANRQDVEKARKEGMNRSLLDRLLLDESRIHSMAESLRETAALPDPIGESDWSAVRPNGLEIRRVRVPLGVIAIIYEARPNVTSEAASLCLKSGNAVILRGGREALATNTAVIAVLRQAAADSGIPAGAIGFIDFTDRAAVDALLKIRGLIDVVIPRGSAALIKKVVENSSVPVIETGAGVCHVFVDKTADLSMADDIIINAKTSRPSVCNAMETLLIHEAVAGEYLPRIARKLLEKNVELRGCERCCFIVADSEIMKEATEADWAAEYDDLILSIKIVSSLDEAVEHINRYSTSHSDAIITRDLASAHHFQNAVDSAAVYVNASTRFTDGFEFGFGAEIGISTQKLHARGPMGLRELTTMKYLIYGVGQVR